MVQSHFSPAAPAAYANDMKTLPTPAIDISATGAFEWSFLGLFAILLGIVSARHEMFRDEVQAFLIARDSHSIGELFRNLRYEGHPALWHLLLYIPAHLSWNPASMQAINYFLAVAEAWLILSARRLHWSVRGLAAFSFFVFYGYGAVARNYMLAMLLLTAAARCLMGERQHRKWAILFLGLAINSHFFAIPIAVILALWAFCFHKLERLSDVGKLMRDSEFWTALVALSASVAAAYFTLRPPSDVYTPQYGREHHSLIHYFLLTEGRAWQIFLPIPALYIPRNLSELLVPKDSPSALAVLVSLVLIGIVTVSLRTNLARRFFLTAAVLELIALAATVRVPPVRHFGLIFASYLIALLMDVYVAQAAPRRAWISAKTSSVLVLLILGVQTLAAFSASASDLVRPFSEAEATGEWLRQAGYAKNTIVVEPGNTAAGIVGYAERPSIYFPACQCFGSFTIWKSDWEMDRVVTLNELQRLYVASHLPVIVVSNWQFDTPTAQRLHLDELRAFANNPIYANENFYVYKFATP